MRLVALLLTLALLVPACAENGVGALEDDVVVVPDGKEDDFLSLSGQEYIIEGRYTMRLEEEYLDADEETRLERARVLAGYWQVAIAWFLTQYFIEKKNDDPNFGYGGFGAMARANTFEDLDIRHEGELDYSFHVYQLIAGRRDMLSQMELTPREDGTHEFVLTIGLPTNAELAELETNDEWYRETPWKNWSPENVDESRRMDLTLAIREELESQDAWFDYVELFEDALLDIDVHFGWDYHNDYHIGHARGLFNWLQREGFQAPVATFEELDRTSGPFTKSIEVGDRIVGIEVRIFYGHPGAESDTNPDTDEGGRVLEQDIRGSLATRDVIIYSGHSGPFYGFAMGNWRSTDEGDFDDSEMGTVEMPANRYQIVFAEGCDTYHIGEAFRRNPAKPNGAFIDIITTTAPSNASSPAAVQDMISSLLRADNLGRHAPRTVKSLLRELDRNSSWFHTMYGVHGIDDNPQLHPYAEIELMCQECEADDDCGGPGNRCVAVGNSGRRCTPSCTSDTGCPSDARCRSIASSWDNTIFDSVCVPANQICQ